jgi:hypothetical protein
VDKLQVYRDKRDPARTPEPVPRTAAAEAGEGPAGGTFVIQDHHARRLHRDFRLERDGVLVSWALPKGVPYDPARGSYAALEPDWVEALRSGYTPFCYAGHALLMAATYVLSMAPSSYISNAIAFQEGDELRRIQRIAYRAR